MKINLNTYRLDLQGYINPPSPPLFPAIPTLLPMGRSLLHTLLTFSNLNSAKSHFFLLARNYYHPSNKHQTDYF